MSADEDDEDRTVQAQAPRSVLPQTAPIVLTPPPRSSARMLARPAEERYDYTEERATVQRAAPPSVGSLRLKTALADDFDPEDTQTTRGQAAWLYGKGLAPPPSSRAARPEPPPAPELAHDVL